MRAPACGRDGVTFGARSAPQTRRAAATRQGARGALRARGRGRERSALIAGGRWGVRLAYGRGGTGRTVACARSTKVCSA